MSDGLLEDDLERPPASIPWVRKRDGRVVPFDPTKLATSIFAARRRVAAENASLVAHEMAAATLHFLVETHGGTVPGTDAVADTVVKVLTQTQQTETAKLYREYRDQRAHRRSRVRLLETAPAATGTSSPTSWDKSQLVSWLLAGGGMEPSLAEEIAGDVEKKILRANLTVITTTLVDEFLRCEMLSRGIPPSRVGSASARQELQIASRQALQTKDLARLAQWAGRRHLEQATLASLYSPDILGLIEEGLLELLGGGSAFHFSVTATSRELGKEPDPRLRWERALSSSLLGVETHVEEWCVPAFPLSESLRLMFHTLASSTNEAEPFIILRGWDPVPSKESASSPEEALFASPSNTSPDSRWTILRTELCKIVREFPRFADRFLLDIPFVSDPANSGSVDPLDFARVVSQGLRVRYRHERLSAGISDGGLRSHAKSQVLQTIGLRLDRLAERVGGDDETFLERAQILAEAALRLGLQKREFMRNTGLIESESAETLIVVPLGLNGLHAMTAEDLRGERSLRLVAKTLQTLSRHLRRAVRPFRMDARIDSPLGTSLFDLSTDGDLNTLRSRLDTFASLHGSAGGGTTRVTIVRAGESTVARSLLGHWCAKGTPGRIHFEHAPAPIQGTLF